MAHRHVALLARRLSLSTPIYPSLQCIPSKQFRHEPATSRQSSSQTTKPRPPNISGLYKALTREVPTKPPDPGLTALLDAAQTSNDAQAAIKILTTNLTTLPIHRNHVTTAVKLCLPSDPTLAENLLSTLSPTIPADVLIPARAALAKHYTSRNDAYRALAALNIPSRLLAASAGKLQTSVEALHLGGSPFVWGTLIKSLTLASKPAHACAVVDVARANRVPVTDAFLHLCINALRMNQRWMEACAMFDHAVATGLAPSERTVASLVFALTSRAARQRTGKQKIVEIVDMVQSPSMKFLNIALMGLTSVGAMTRAERVFVEVRSARVEDAHFEMMLAGLGNYVELLPAEEVDKVDAGRYTEISRRADELWKEYLRLFPGGRNASSVLAKVIRVKTRCFHGEQAVDVLEGVVDSGRGDIITISHVGGVLGAVELLCDVGMLERVLVVMKKARVAHDMRSAAFWIGTLLGDGNMGEAVDVVRNVVLPLVKNGETGAKAHYPTILVRRLRSLGMALKDGGVGKVKEVEEAIEIVERLQGDLSGREMR